MQLLIPVAFGQEQTTKRQLNSLGFEKAPAENGRIRVDGDWTDVAKLNVSLRSGERVLIQLAQFTAVTFDELYEGVYAIPWENYLTVESKILMDGKSVQSTLAAIKAAGGVAKKAIIRRLGDKIKTGRKTFAETGARTIVGVSLFKDVATITIDTSGDGLHKRGYRSLAYSAPLKETLAAGIIDESFYNPEKDEGKPFADLFCGSGTLPIEAAMKALRMSPNANRNFDFERWICTPKDVANHAREEAKDRIRWEAKPCIFGGDINPDAISIAKYHAKKAGVDKYIRFAVADAKNFSSQIPYGVLISNPPYGERLSDENAVRKLMQQLGNTFRALPDWNAYLLTSLPDFERWFGKSAHKKKKLYNANLLCGLYCYFGKAPKENDKKD
ncbi:MAG: class I SAM-dependent RNA methyltransferase [Clostridiales bacterium]|nr:class I SAM-dependent RNA methyltransferase [Clostridiales bacterium]